MNNQTVPVFVNGGGDGMVDAQDCARTAGSGR